MLMLLLGLASALKMEAVCSAETLVPVCILRGVSSQNAVSLTYTWDYNVMEV
jgi:hypothetical protein